MKKPLLIVLLCLIFFGFSVQLIYAAPLSNAGLIPGEIWFSVATPKEGETISIYTLFFNGTPSTLSGSVEFYDKGAILDAVTFTVGPQESEQLSILWKVNAGDHVVSARVINVVSTAIGGESTSVYLTQNTTESNSFFVPRSNFSPQPSDGSVAPILNKVDSIESKFTAWIPVPIKKAITALMNAIESFRIHTVEQYSIKNLRVLNDRDLLTARLLEMQSHDQAASPSMRFVEMPLVYGKLFFVALVLFMFNSQFLFYGFAILLSVFLLDRLVYGIKKLFAKIRAVPPTKTYKSLKS